MKKWTIIKGDEVKTAVDFDEAYKIAIGWIPKTFMGRILTDNYNKTITVEV